MPQAQPHQFDQTSERHANRPSRVEFSDILPQPGGVEGLSLEWVFERFEHKGTQQ